MGSKPVSSASVPSWLLLEFLHPGSCLEFLLWLPLMTDSDMELETEINPFFSQLLVIMVFIRAIERKSEYHRIILSEIMVAWVFSSFLSEYVISKWLSFGRALLLLVPQLVSLVLGVQWWQCWKAPAVTQATYVMCSEAIKGMNNGVCTPQTCGELGWHWCHLASRKVDQRL